MILIRKSQDRGHAQHGWLDSYHSFSFADYYDPKWMGFRSLRVINEDRVAAAQGFGSHPHKDMEIITYVLSGQLKHKDNMGNEGLINPGEVQKMSAGSGVVHSEFNASSKEEVHLLQIWIMPDAKGLKPSYEQNLLPVDQHNSLFAFPVTIHQDAKVFRGRLSKGHELIHKLNKERGAWVQMISGLLSVNDSTLEAGDAAVIEKETGLHFTCPDKCEFLLFDLK
jgi:redox-sensitive bicupin YhaK (pirin superfamily)